MKKTYMCPQAKEIAVKLEGIIAESPNSLTGDTMGIDAQGENESSNNLAKEDFGW